MSADGNDRLPEERVFREVLAGCVAVTATFTLGFVIALLDRVHFARDTITASWFEAWGTWAGGIGAAAAFLIAAASIAVTGAHARADRRADAQIRESEDMAQARLLIVYQVDMPTQPQGFRFYRIDNRSKDMFFDVTVPFATRHEGATSEQSLLTPEAFTGNGTVTMEYLPQGELLAPYRSQSQNDIWFTEVRVYAAPNTPVDFTVHYTDGAGRSWKQHLNGTIERVPTSEAVQQLPRQADTVQPFSQLRTITKEEARDPASLFSDVPAGLMDDDQDMRAAEEAQDALNKAREIAELEAIAPTLVQTWKPATRIGTPQLSLLAGNTIRAEIAYAPKGPLPWRNYLVARLREAGYPSNQFRSQGNVEAMILETDEDRLAETVECVDAAISHANDTYEANELKNARAVVARIDARNAEKAKARARLDALAAEYSKPGETPWNRHQRRAREPQSEGPSSSSRPGGGMAPQPPPAT